MFIYSTFIIWFMCLVFEILECSAFCFMCIILIPIKFISRHISTFIVVFPTLRKNIFSSSEKRHVKVNIFCGYNHLFVRLCLTFQFIYSYAFGYKNIINVVCPKSTTANSLIYRIYLQFVNISIV